MKTLTLNLNEIQKDLLIGTLLGDAHLSTKTKGRTWSYQAKHSIKQEAYLLHKYEVLKTLCKSPPRKVETMMRGKTHHLYAFSTLTQTCLRFYGNLFYTYTSSSDSMIKDVPLNIAKFLTPRAIAYWYMDDGTLKWKGKSNGMVICTESFSEHGVYRLQNALKVNNGIDTTLIRRKNHDRLFLGYRLYINEKNSGVFRELIKPFLIPSLYYKVSDGNKNFLVDS